MAKTKDIVSETPAPEPETPTDRNARIASFYDGIKKESEEAINELARILEDARKKYVEILGIEIPLPNGNKVKIVEGDFIFTDLRPQFQEFIETLKIQRKSEGPVRKASAAKSSSADAGQYTKYGKGELEPAILKAVRASKSGLRASEIKTELNMKTAPAIKLGEMVKAKTLTKDGLVYKIPSK